MFPHWARELACCPSLSPPGQTDWAFSGHRPTLEHFRGWDLRSKPFTRAPSPRSIRKGCPGLCCPSSASGPLTNVSRKYEAKEAPCLVSELGLSLSGAVSSGLWQGAGPPLRALALEGSLGKPLAAPGLPSLHPALPGGCDLWCFPK